MKSTKMRPFLRLLGFTSILLSANTQAIAVGEIPLGATILQPLQLPAEPSKSGQEQLSEQPTLTPEVPAPVWLVVKQGQTLWRIAVNNSPKGIGPWQTLISLYRENPTAFRHSDIRQVMANSKLRLPTLVELSSLTAEQAKAAYDILVPAPVSAQHELPVKTSEHIAQGLAEQEQDINSLNQQRAQIETHILVLDQQLEAKQADLNQAKQDLVQAKQVLVETLENSALAAQTNAFNDKDDQFTQWFRVVQMSAFWWLPLIVMAGLIWWVIGRRRRVLPEHKTPRDTLKEESITLDAHEPFDTPVSSATSDTVAPLTDYDTKPSAKAHLSVDVEAMLTGQRIMHNQADEPVDYLSHDEKMNTKLDLALSYRDMGEAAKAQSILREVLQQGDAEQQAQANAILSSINRA